MAEADPALALARRLESWGNGRGWRGPDPYEGLNARRVPRSLVSTPLGRRLLIQAVKRSPVDLRPALGIAPEADAASVAFVASAYARNGFLETGDAATRLREALALLETLRSPGHSLPCWGYHFEFQSRVVHYQRGEPNTIATAFAGHALLDAHAALGDAKLLDHACGVGRFFIEHIELTPSGEGACFGYHPGDRSLIHNANMLVCALLSRLRAAGRDEGGFAEAAESAALFTLGHQHADGSWPYGERDDLRWIDGFHTGYVLDALRTCADSGLLAEECTAAWQRGVAFYRRELFLGDGTAKYASKSLYPIDTQCVAQGIQTLAIAARHGEVESDLPWRVLEFALDRMVGSAGLPLFQRRRLWVNRTPHVRWTVAPLLRALAELLACTQPLETSLGAERIP